MILRIQYKHRVTNEEVCAKIQKAIEPHEDILTIVKRRNLQRYGHVSLHQVWPNPDAICSSMVMYPFIRSGQNHLAGHSERREDVKADRKKGGKTTLGNGQAWSSPSPRGQWKTEKKWRKLVVKSSEVPQRLPRLRER